MNDQGADDYRERLLGRFGAPPSPAAPDDDELEDEDDDVCEHGVSLSDDCEDCADLEDEDDYELDDEE